MKTKQKNTFKMFAIKEDRGYASRVLLSVMPPIPDTYFYASENKYRLTDESFGWAFFVSRGSRPRRV